MARTHTVNPQVNGIPNAAQQARLDAGESLTRLWPGEMQQVIVNMRDAPRAFARGLGTALPGVRVVRLNFNIFSFNADGSMHPQMEEFIDEACKRGFRMLWVLMDGPSQENGDAKLLADWPDSYRPVQTIQDWRNLMPYLAQRHRAAWAALLAWLAMRPAVATWGFEAINEPATYQRGVERFSALKTEMVQTYCDHCVAIFDQVRAAYPDAPFLVGGWGYSATFAMMRDTTLANGKKALAHLRDTIGANLHWSIHFYPQWSTPTLSLTTLENFLTARFGMLAGDKAIITEFNLNNDWVNDPVHTGGQAANIRSTFMLGRAARWFHEADMGIGWWPVANYAAGYMIFIKQNGGLKMRQQNTYAGALGLWSYGNDGPMHAGLPASGPMPITAIATDEIANADSDWDDPADGKFDAATRFTYGFGSTGLSVLTGEGQSNNFLYGGDGRSILYGGARDDFLMLAQGGGVARAGGGNNVVYVNGGEGRVYCGPGYTSLSLILGKTQVVLDPAGNTIIFGFDPNRGDRVSFMGAFANSTLMRDAARTQSSGSYVATETDLVIDLPAGGQVVFYNGAGLLAKLNKNTLDFTSGWYGAGWTEPADYDPADF